MGSQFSIIIGGLVATIYTVMGSKYHGDVKYNLENTEKHEDYTLRKEYANDTDKSRKIIPSQSPFILYKLSKDKRVTVVDDPFYLNIGQKGGFSIPVGGGSHTEVENKTICKGWHGITPMLDGEYQTFDGEEYNKQLFLNTPQAVTDFCHDVGLATTQYQLKPTVRADFITTNTLHILSGRGTYYIGTNRQKMIESASMMITKRSYPGFIGIGMVGVCALCFGVLIR